MKIKEIFDLRKPGGQIYFMSDLHYNHANVIRLSKRTDFYDVYAMNSYIEKELSEVIKPEDIIFDLGDTTWRLQAHEAKAFWEGIPSKNIYKIMGNHDKYALYRGTNPLLQKYFRLICDMLEITVIDTDGTVIPIFMMHYPSIDFPGMYRGGIHIFGHTHGHLDSMLEKDPRLMVDVGFDGNLAKSVGSFLISIDDILDYFYEKTQGDEFSKYAKENFQKEDDSDNEGSGGEGGD